VCGIAGAVNPDAGRDVGPVVTGLTTALAHRGPDGSGFHFTRGRSIALGHRRLSIVDVAGGAQPMANEDRRVWVVLNGELYNHLDLRRELERCGHQFRTRADTEVLVHGWEEWGTGLLERLNGMYAFGLLDEREGAPMLWLARDPVGVKPLYVGLTDGTWWFSSELAACRRAALIRSAARSIRRVPRLSLRPLPGHVLPERLEGPARALLADLAGPGSGAAGVPTIPHTICSRLAPRRAV
jgi:asparagine synthase (glutamine-hydrolysing)